MKSMSICSVLSLQIAHMKGEFIHKLKSACIKSKKTVEQYGYQRKNDPRLYVRSSYTNSSLWVR